LLRRWCEPSSETSVKEGVPAAAGIALPTIL
jgi:hypothetical protein